MQVRLLGPVDIVAGGTPRDLQGLRRKAVLAALALSHGEVLSTDRLLDIVWGPAAAARVNTLQSHVSYLRRALGGRTAIAARPPGYRLSLAGDATDLMVAERLIEQAAKDADPADGAAAFRAALDLWRGQSLADLAHLGWFGEQAQRLEQLRLVAVEGLARARLELGEHADLLPELELLARQHPFDERLHAHLMVALYRVGRQHDALTAYQRLTRILDDELGISPSPLLRDLHTAILRQDPGLEGPPAPVAVTAPVPASPVPAQLPASTRTFAGRAAELARLDDLLATDPGGPPPTVIISAVSGTAGVGKTALAVFWAHRVAGRFPGGQLYVNLRGYDPSGPALDPAEAVRGFLDALGVPAERIPAALPAQAALYRSLLAGQRILVVLDNARSSEQVRPLLPGSPGCLAIVTSRDYLGGLVATEGAYPLALDMLSAGEARDLLAGRLGAGRVASEPGAVDDIIAGCARLPLALAIAAARAAVQPGFPLAVLAGELREASMALDALHEDAATDIRAVLSWSYRTLSSDAARLFRLLGLHPGPDISAPAAASLAGLALRPAVSLLTELVRASLLTEHVPGRYTFHDLLRASAAEQARSQETDDARREAIYRVLDHYLRTAESAAALISPTSDSGPTVTPRPGVAGEEIGDYEQALAWFTAERPVLLAVVRQAAGFGPYAWQLPSALIAFLDLKGHWHDLKAAQASALAAARRHGDQGAQATARRGLGLACAGLKEFDGARAHYLLALDLFGQAGHRTGQAKTHLSLAWMAGMQGRQEEALDHCRQSLRLYQDAGMLAGQAKALNNIGWLLAEQHQYAQALEHCQRALAILQVVDDRDNQAHTSDTLGYIYYHLGRHREAIESYQQALHLFRAAGDSYGEAFCLGYLGDVYDAAGDAGDARRAWLRALGILDGLNHSDADQIRAKLRARTTEAAHAQPGTGAAPPARPR
jgi:DNA-binding SARP family transcriptional activator/Tfp pilus assembly protein PilF